MTGVAIVWLAGAALVGAVLVMGRSRMLHRRLRLSDLDWKAVVVLAVVLGAVPAFVYSQWQPRPVAVPATVNDRGVIPRQ